MCEMKLQKIRSNQDEKLQKDLNDFMLKRNKIQKNIDKMTKERKAIFQQENDKRLQK